MNNIRYNLVLYILLKDIPEESKIKSKEIFCEIFNKATSRDMSEYSLRFARKLMVNGRLPKASNFSNIVIEFMASNIPLKEDIDTPYNEAQFYIFLSNEFNRLYPDW